MKLFQSNEEHSNQISNLTHRKRLDNLLAEQVVQVTLAERVNDVDVCLPDEYFLDFDYVFVKKALQ